MGLSNFFSSLFGKAKEKAEKAKEKAEKAREKADDVKRNN